LLVCELTNSPSLKCRIAAAHALNRRGYKAAVPAMIDEWHAWRARDAVGPPGWEDEFTSVGVTDSGDPFADNGNYYEHGDGAALAHFLVTADSPAAVRVIGSALEGGPTWLPGSVIDSLCPGRRKESPEGSLPLSPPLPTITGPFSDECEAEIASLLASIVHNHTTPRAWRVDLDPFAETNLVVRDTWRVCDLAAMALSRRYPKRFSFDLEASMVRRDEQRAEILNSWHRETGLPMLALRGAVFVPLVAPREILPLLETVRGAESVRDVEKEFARLESWGLAALAHIVDYLDEHGTPFPAREPLMKTAIRSSQTVCSASVRPLSEELKALSRELAELEGTAMTGEVFCRVVRTVLGRVTRNSGVVWIDLERSNALTGTRLSVEYRPNETVSTTVPELWSWTQRVVANRNDMLLGKRGAPSPDALSKAASGSLAGYVDYAFALGPAVPVDISVQVTAEPPGAGDGATVE